MPRLLVPSDVPGLGIWLDGNDGPTVKTSAGGNAANGQTVGRWQDKSVLSGARTGNPADMTQDRTANMPPYNTSAINGMPALAPTGSHWMAIQNAANQPPKYSSATGISGMAVVTRPSATGTIFSGGYNNNDAGGPQLRFDQNQVNVVRSYQSDIVRTGAAAAGPHVIGFDASSAGTTAFLDGVGTTASRDAAFTAPLSQIFGNAFGTEYLNAPCGEIIYYLRRVSNAERQQIEGYLAWKWGLQELLANNHPYKSAAPMYASNDNAIIRRRRALILIAA